MINHPRTSPGTVRPNFTKSNLDSAIAAVFGSCSQAPFSTYHSENLLLEGDANGPPAVGGFGAATFGLLATGLPCRAGGAELLLLVPVHRGAAACTRPGPAGCFGTLWTLLGHMQLRLRLAWVGQRGLNMGHRLASRRHGGNWAAGEDSGVWTDGDRRGAVVVTDG